MVECDGHAHRHSLPFSSDPVMLTGSEEVKREPMCVAKP
jgi:hypothetical protein